MVSVAQNGQEDVSLLRATTSWISETTPNRGAAHTICRILGASSGRLIKVSSSLSDCCGAHRSMKLRPPPQASVTNLRELSPLRWVRWASSFFVPSTADGHHENSLKR